jgi:uncharacterized membrane protein YeaQ/YmgE (transglycosylase-associated protein family)
MFSLIGWVIFGALVGAIARWIMPGRDPLGCAATVLLGVLGSVVGGLLLGFLAGERDGGPAGWIGSVLGALLLLWLYRRFGADRRPRR